MIVATSFSMADCRPFGPLILDFIEWFTATQNTRAVVSLRDILAWVRFMDACVGRRQLAPEQVWAGTWHTAWGR